MRVRLTGAVVRPDTKAIAGHRLARAIGDPVTLDRQQRLAAAIRDHRAGRIDLAEPVYRRLVEEDPANAEALHMMAVAALHKDQLDNAIDFANKAIAANERDARFHNTLGAAYLETDRPEEAEAAFRQALERDPVFQEARFNLGNALIKLKDFPEAAAAYRAVIGADPTHVEALNNLGATLRQGSLWAQAVEFLTRAEDLQPGHPDVLANLAECLERLNRVDEAVSKVDRLLEIAPQSTLGHLLKARLERRLGKPEEAAERLRRVLPGADRAHISGVLFELGQALDQLGETTEAFDAFRQANEQAAAWISDFDAKSDWFYQLTERCRDWFTPERLEALLPGEPTVNAHDPLFLVGFPRSGTTLIEQMLDAHPDLITTGERSPLERLVRDIQRDWDYPACLAEWTDDHIERLREAFWHHTAQILAAPFEGLRLVDKMPLNIVHIALIGRLFPGAPVVVSLRDPRDACLSCFMQMFHLPGVMAHFNQLETTVQLYTSVMGLWLQYRERPPVRCLEYRYEDLVDDFEAVIRRILDLVCVPWDERILSYRETIPLKNVITPSYSNVSEKLYTRARGRWHRYRTEFEPFTRDLAPFVSAFGYE